MMDFSQIKEIDKKYSTITYPRHNLCFCRGEGNYLYDTNDRAYLDFVAGLGESCLGYRNAMLLNAIKEQTDQIISYSNLYYNELHSSLVKTIIDDTAFTKVCLGGSIGDTILITAYMLSKYGVEAKDNRSTILVVSELNYSRYEAMHSENLHIKYVKPDEQEFKKALTSDVCAAIFNPIQVEYGMFLTKYEFLLSAYAACKSQGITIIYDETSIGIGRTGTMFAFEQYGIQPDIALIARGMAGGLPMGAVLSRGEIANALEPSDRISIFCTSSVACAAAKTIFTCLKNGMLEEVQSKGEYLMSKLSKFKKYNFVADIRGVGLFAGIELTPALKAARIIGQMESLGFLLDQSNHNTLRITPPFTITESEIDAMCEALSEIFDETNM